MINAIQNSREMDIELPKDAEVWVTVIHEGETEPTMHKIMMPVTEIKIINPEVEK